MLKHGSAAAEKRRQFSADELKSYQGKWVAISSDGSQILASGTTEIELTENAEAIGLKRTDYVMEPIPNLDESLLL